MSERPIGVEVIYRLEIAGWHAEGHKPEIAKAHVHSPVLLTPDLFDAWLRGEAGPEVLRPAAETALREWVVSGRVNRTGHDDDDAALVEAA